MYKTKQGIKHLLGKKVQWETEHNRGNLVWFTPNTGIITQVKDKNIEIDNKDWHYVPDMKFLQIIP